MVNVAIYGASGYAGQELVRLLLGHPRVKIAAINSRKLAPKAIFEIYPHFEGLTDLKFTELSPQETAEMADVIFLALPHGSSMEIAPILLKAGRKVIDLSADFRLRSPETYKAWYGPHTNHELLSQAAYGIPELERSRIAASRLIANPGCYPTSVILALAPLLKSAIIERPEIIVDSKSGVSGAGREAQTGSLFCEVSDGFKAYKIGQHRHTPEMEQELSLLAGSDIRITFTPHLLPVSRGILSTIYVMTDGAISEATLRGIYEDHYRREPFIRLYRAGQFPNISSVRGTNFCDIALHVDERLNRITLIAAIDNLVKGASGQAIQNMNIVCGFPETAGLDSITAFP